MDRQHSALLPEALWVDRLEIDAQHEQIFTFLETLKSTCFGSSYLPMEGFRRLAKDFEQHFAEEELLAETFGLDCSGHTAVHKDAIRTIRESLDDVLTGASDAYSFLRYMEFWLERHIVRFDKPLMAAMKKVEESHSHPA